MDPIIGGALITGGAKLLSGLFGSSSASSAAKAQLQATRETNEMNYKIWQEQRQAEIDMWNMQNEYNDPSAQMERLRNAGINPYMAMANASNPAGVASSSPSTGQAPTMQTADSSAFQQQAQGNPWYGVFQGLSEGAMNFGNTWSTMTNAQTNKDVGNSQIALNNANTDFTLIRKDWAPQLWSKELEEKDSRIALNKVDYDFKRETFQIRKDTLDASLVRIQLGNKHQEVLNKYVDAKEQISLGIQCQQLCNLVEIGKLTKEQVIETQTRSLLNRANSNLAYSQSKYYGAMTGNVQVDTDQKRLDYDKAKKLVEDEVNTTLAMNAYQRSMALANTFTDDQIKKLNKANYDSSLNTAEADSNLGQIRKYTQWWSKGVGSVLDPVRGVLGGSWNYRSK